MIFKNEQLQGLGIALNEANLLGAEVDTVMKRAALTLGVLTLPIEGPISEDNRVQILLSPVTRVAASLRCGRRDDQSAKIEPFTIDQLLEVVQSFHGLPIYGWEFFNTGGKGFEKWSGGLSLDYQNGSWNGSNTLDLFQEGHDRHLDLRFWFNEMLVRKPGEKDVSLEEFIAGGKRWWDAFYKKDPKTQGRGMFPLQ